MSEGVLLTEEAVSRIAGAVRRVESWHWDNPVRPEGGQGPIVGETLFAITTAAAADAYGHFNATITKYLASSDTWSNYTNIKLEPANSETLSNGTRYPIKAAGKRADGERVYVVAQSTSSAANSFSGCLVALNSDITSWPNNYSGQGIPWQEELLDTDGYFNSSSGTVVNFVLPSDGIYTAGVAVVFSPTTIAGSVNAWVDANDVGGLFPFQQARQLINVETSGIMNNPVVCNLVFAGVTSQTVTLGAAQQGCGCYLWGRSLHSTEFTSGWIYKISDLPSRTKIYRNVVVSDSVGGKDNTFARA